MEILTDKQVDLIQKMIAAEAMEDWEIAERFKLPVRAIRALRASRWWDRSPSRYPVGDGRRLKVPEIALLAQVSRVAIWKRLAKGVKGRELLAPAKEVTKVSKRGKPIPRKRKLVPRDRD